MYRLARPPRRQGFTLIEILVVVAILAILVALVASGISRVKTSQLSRNTEGTVTKLQQAIDGQWRAILDQCKQDRLRKSQSGGYSTGVSTSVAFNSVQAFCSNDADRAEALWVYLNLKREFPQSFAEASNSVVLLNTSGTVVVSLPPRQTFVSVLGASVTGDLPPNGANLQQSEAESAVLLYLILAEKANKGANFSADDVTTGAQTTLGGFKVFTDAWGTPIKFIRFADSTVSPEIGQLPYANAPAATLAYPNPTPDPIDPLGKLTSLTANWTIQQQTAALNALNNLGSTTQLGAQPSVVFGASKLPTVVAAGPKALAQGNPNPLAFGGANSDDFFGYRYRRQGNK